MRCAQCSHEVKPEPSCGTFQELKTLVGIDVDPTALELATARLEAQKPPATQLHLLPGNVRCARLRASGCQCKVQSTGPAKRRHLLCYSAAWQRLQLTLPVQLLHVGQPHAGLVAHRHAASSALQALEAWQPHKLRGMRSAESWVLNVLQSAAGASAPGAGLQRWSLC